MSYINDNNLDLLVNTAKEYGASLDKCVVSLDHDSYGDDADSVYCDIYYSEPDVEFAVRMEEYENKLKKYKAWELKHKSEIAARKLKEEQEKEEKRIAAVEREEKHRIAEIKRLEKELNKLKNSNK